MARWTSGTTRGCSPRATGATWSTATATGPSRRSSPTSTPAGTTSTSRSRTGSTTSTSARSCAPPTRSSPPRCTSSATGGGTAAARWSPTATSTCATTRASPTWRRTSHEHDVRLLGIDNLPGSDHLETMTIPRRVCFLFGQEGPGLSRGRPRGVRRHLLDRPVRLDPVDQRLRRCGDRHARLGPAARRPVRRRRLARLKDTCYRFGASTACQPRDPPRRGVWPAARRPSGSRSEGGGHRGGPSPQGAVDVPRLQRSVWSTRCGAEMVRHDPRIR